MNYLCEFEMIGYELSNALLIKWLDGSKTLRQIDSATGRHSFQLIPSKRSIYCDVIRIYNQYLLFTPYHIVLVSKSVCHEWNNC